MRDLRVNQVGDLGGHGVQAFGSYGKGHAFLRAERVDQQGDITAFRVFEQQCGAAGFHHAVGDFGDLQIRVGGPGNAFQFALPFQRLHKVLQ